MPCQGPGINMLHRAPSFVELYHMGVCEAHGPDFCDTLNLLNMEAIQRAMREPEGSPQAMGLLQVFAKLNISRVMPANAASGDTGTEDASGGRSGGGDGASGTVAPAPVLISRPTLDQGRQPLFPYLRDSLRTISSDLHSQLQPRLMQGRC